MGKGTDGIWIMEESDREPGTPAWLLDGTLHRGNGEGDTSSLEEPGTLGGLRDCSGVDEDLGRKLRMEEMKEQDSGRGIVPIPLSNVRILQPGPAAQGGQLKTLRVGKEREQSREETTGATMAEVELKLRLNMFELLHQETFLSTAPGRIITITLLIKSD